MGHLRPSLRNILTLSTLARNFHNFTTPVSRNVGNMSHKTAGALNKRNKLRQAAKSRTPADVTYKIRRGTMINKIELRFKTACSNAFPRKHRLCVRGSRGGKKMAHAQNYDAINTSKNKHCRYQIKKKKAIMADTKRAKVKKKKERTKACQRACSHKRCLSKQKRGWKRGRWQTVAQTSFLEHCSGPICFSRSHDKGKGGQ